jgi:hypothetical protein
MRAFDFGALEIGRVAGVGLLLLTLTTLGRAQQLADSISVARSITAVMVDYLGVKVSQERRLGNSISLLYGLGAHYSFYTTNFPVGGTRFINVVDPYFGRDYATSHFVPYVALEGRLYTTLFKRFMRSKNISHNAANYVGAFVELPFAAGQLISVPNLQLARAAGLRYGLRRNLSRHLYFDGSVGVVAKISSAQRTLLPRLDGGFSWTF